MQFLYLYETHMSRILYADRTLCQAQHADRTLCQAQHADRTLCQAQHAEYVNMSYLVLKHNMSEIGRAHV